MRDQRDAMQQRMRRDPRVGAINPVEIALLYRAIPFSRRTMPDPRALPRALLKILRNGAN